LNLPYLLPRIVRHFLPERIVRFLLLRSLVIRPGLETREPLSAVQRYVDVLAEQGASLQGKRVMVFGYGGRFISGPGCWRLEPRQWCCVKNTPRLMMLTTACCCRAMKTTWRWRGKRCAPAADGWICWKPISAKWAHPTLPRLTW
jgi:hypothetical protein